MRVAQKGMICGRRFATSSPFINGCFIRYISNDTLNQIGKSSDKKEVVKRRKVNPKANHHRRLSFLSKNEGAGQKLIVLQRSLSNLKRTDKYTPLEEWCDPIDNVPDICPELQSVLFSPGVHYMRDPRTRHLNFSPELLNIPNVDNFKFDKVTPFISPNRDQRLLKIASSINSSSSPGEPKLKYYSSSSSLTGILRLFHILLGNNRPLDTGFLSKAFPATTNMSPSCTYPVSSVVTLKNKDPSGKNHIFSIDSDRTADTELILSMLGNALELMLTVDPLTFKTYLKASLEDPASAENAKSSYHYARYGNLLMRSQLDAKDKRLPGTGVFDLKTRAVCAIRYDIAHTNFYPTNYEINRTYGPYESFERELFEMASIVMFKYSLQVRIGNMDGIFVAYHNVKNMLGFQYIPLSQMDSIFFGRVGKEDSKLNKANADGEEQFRAIVDDIGQHWQNKEEALSTMMADYEFNVSLSMLQDLLNVIMQKTGSRPFRMFLTYFAGRSISDSRIEVCVNVIDPVMAKSLTRMEDDTHSKNIPPSERVKKATLAAKERRQHFDNVNRSIFDHSPEDGKFLFEISCSHKINGKYPKKRYPTPPLSIVDKNTTDEWNIEYKIKEIRNPGLFKERYFQIVKRLSRTFGMMSILDIVGNTADSSRHSSRYATHKQNVLRAYSEKAVRRLKMFRNSIFYHKKEE